MLLKEYKSYFSRKLVAIYPQTEIDTFFFYLIEEYLGLQRIDISLNPTLKITEKKKVFLDNSLNRLLKEEPIQYILGKTEFYGLPLTVTKNTLIPRPETEELVEWVIKEVQEKTKNITFNEAEKSLKILDIGTGTGCIPISLKKHLSYANVSAIDISKEALEIAKQNAKINEVNINFIETNILTTKKLPQQYHIIVSNPPYVRNLEKVEIKNNVLQNEPHLALFVEDDNPLIFYSKIADLAKSHLTKNGLLFFEINQYLGSETVAMLNSKGFTNIILRKDMFGNDRMVKANFSISKINHKYN